MNRTGRSGGRWRVAGTVEDGLRPAGPVPRSRGQALARDTVAGVSVAMIGIRIPQSLAYAELAGMSPIVGLYAGAIPPILAAVTERVLRSERDPLG